MKTDIKEKIMSLLAKANDPAASEAEAMSALTMARRLMDKHGLTEAECEAATGDDFVERVWAGKHTEKYGTVFHPVDRLCCSTIAKFCGVRYWYKRPAGREQMEAAFFGLEGDVALAEWMRASLIKQFDIDWNIYVRITREKKTLASVPAARVAFSDGFAKAYRARLEDWLYRTPEKLDGYDNALVFKKQDLISAELERRGIKIGSRAYAGPKVTDGLAAGAGYNSGKTAKISNDIGYGRPVIALTKR